MRAPGRWLGIIGKALKDDLGSKSELYLAVILTVASVAALPISRKFQMTIDQLAVLGVMLLLGGVRLWLPLALDLMAAVVSVDNRVPLKPWALLTLCAVLLWTGCLGFAHVLAPALVEAYTKLDAGDFERAVKMISGWLAASLAIYAAGFVCAFFALGALCFSLFKSRPLSKMMAVVATVALALSLMLLATTMLGQATSLAFVGQELALYDFSRGQSTCAGIDKTALVHALPGPSGVIVWSQGEFKEKPCQLTGVTP
jgi:hypothetical protein